MKKKSLKLCWNLKRGDYVAYMPYGEVKWTGKILKTDEVTGEHTILTNSGERCLHDSRLVAITQEAHESGVLFR